MFGGVSFNYIFMVMCFFIMGKFIIGKFMKKYLVLGLFFVTGIAYASGGEHFNFSHDLLSAFENCTPYSSQELKQENLAKNEIVEEYNSIDVIGKRDDKCVFDLILQMQSIRLYAKTVKRCMVTSEQQKSLLEGMKDVYIDSGKRFNKELLKIIDQMGCYIISDEEENMQEHSPDHGYLLIKDR